MIEKDDAITPEEMTKIDKGAMDLGIPSRVLMENAGNSVQRTVNEKIGRDIRVVVFSGTGNNGGDGFVVARRLANAGAEVDVFLLGDPDDIRTEDARLNLEVIKNMGKGVSLSVVENASELDKARTLVERADVSVDAMLGTGVEGRLRDQFASAVEILNGLKTPVVSVDVPTGLDALTGEVHGVAVKSDWTVTFHLPKKGLVESEEHTGEIIVSDIGIPEKAEEGILDD